MTIIKRDSIAYVVIIGFCVLMLVWGIPTYTPEYPGYGASPALVANVAVSLMMVMAIFSLIRVAAAKRRHQPGENQSAEDVEEDSGFTQVGRVKLAHLTGIMLPSIFLVIFIDYIGYELASFIFLMALQYIMGNRNLKQSIILSLILTAVLYVVMRYGFGVPVPGPQIFS